MPTLMHKLPIPFIWGPVGGAEGVPLPFIGALPWKDMIIQYFRRILVRSLGINPLVRGPARVARAIIARTTESQQVFRGYEQKTVVMLETGMDEHSIEDGPPVANVTGETVTFVYVGRLVAFKGVEFGIRAFARASAVSPRLRLRIVGDGPLRESLSDSRPTWCR